jgi:hypothetical protein
MNLYKLSLIDSNYKGSQWDIYCGFVIAAASPTEAREMADKTKSGDEQNFNLETGESDYKNKNNIWLKAKYTKLQKIGTAGAGVKKGIILEDYNAG